MAVLNRRAPVTLYSQKEYPDAREALAAAGIPGSAKMRGMARAIDRTCAAGGLREECSYTVYVRRKDYGRASGQLRLFRRGV